MSHHTNALFRMQKGSTTANLYRKEVINAIADLALAARAGTTFAAYRREWAWVDAQNYVDAVDADEFNAAFHGIEREFDRLAQVLAQGSGLSMAPDWEQTFEVTGTQPFTIDHNLDSMDLLVDIQLGFTVTDALVKTLPNLTAGTFLWTNLGSGTNFAYLLPDDNSIMIVFQGHGPLGTLGTAVGESATLRVRIWKLGE